MDAEKTGGVLQGGGRPDVLVEEASGWPVVIEAELSDHTGAEKDAIERLGRTVERSGRSIETAIALVYPSALHTLDGQALRAAIGSADDFEYALYTRQVDEAPERLPSSGWLRGSVRDLAMLVHRAVIPAQRVDRLAEELERGVGYAANRFTWRQPYGGGLGAELAKVLGQTDDDGGQTRRMVMTVILNALVFHTALSDAGFQIGPEGARRTVRGVNTFGLSGGGFRISGILHEWEAILEENYWPIFASAYQMLRQLPVLTGNDVLGPLWYSAEELIRDGVTRSHDLTGVVFQRLIADRKFLATYYTQPAAAALLAGLAIPPDRAPGGADWSDAETLQALQVGDFACGTGTLLSAAYQRLSSLHELHGGDPKALHGPMMQHGLVGLDVLNIAVHLTAAMLAGSYPDTPFEGECLLTMAYGKKAAIGSLELLAESVQDEMISEAAAVTAGGRKPEDVRDLVTRVQHGKFDLVIMNPPFTRPTNHEASHANVPIPAYAAFETTTEEQREMARRVRDLTKAAPSNDNAGVASHFVELAHRKARPGGVVAMVLPLSAVSGGSWGAVREQWCGRYTDTIVVTIAGADSDEASFSADTGMAECLLIGQKNGVRNSRPEASSPSWSANLSPRCTVSLSPPKSVGLSMAARSGALRTARSVERRLRSAVNTAAMCSTAYLKARASGRSWASPTLRSHRQPINWSVGGCSGLMTQPQMLSLSQLFGSVKWRIVGLSTETFCSRRIRRHGPRPLRADQVLPSQAVSRHTRCYGRTTPRKNGSL